MLTRGESSKIIHRTTADERRERMSSRPQPQPRTLEGGYESTHPERVPTRVRTKPKKLDDNLMNYATRKWTAEDTETLSSSSKDEELGNEITTRALHRYVNTKNQQ